MESIHIGYRRQTYTEHSAERGHSKHLCKVSRWSIELQKFNSKEESFPSDGHVNRGVTSQLGLVNLLHLELSCKWGIMGFPGSDDPHMQHGNDGYMAGF